MNTALEHAKQYDYDRAIAVLERLVELTDYRFKEASADAAKAIDKIQALRDRNQAAARAATAKALDAFEKGHIREIVQILGSVPSKLLDRNAQKLLARAQSVTAERTSLESSLRQTVAAKDWVQVGILIQQLLNLEPDDPQGLRLAPQVTAKLVARARKLLDEGEYESAVLSLGAIPDIAVNDEIRSLQESAANIHWLTEQFDAEPYASPLLGRLAVRLAKETPKDPRTQKLVQQLSHQLKQAPRPPRMHLPRWKGSTASWLGGEAGILGIPSRIRVGDASELRSAAGRFNIAIGLALQGLGKTRISEDFLIKKKGLLSLGRRKRKSCWGLDIGTSAVKGILLQETEDGVEAVDVFFFEFETPISRRRADVSEHTVLLPAIEKFLEKMGAEETPVWANFASSRTVNRFVRLPPVKDKEAQQLLTQEVESKVPVPVDELVIVHWIHADREAVLGRPAVACTARRTIVHQRIELLESCGLKLAGLQCDSIALANFGAYEFAELWSEIDETVEQEDHAAYEDAISKTVVLIDCGASATNLVLVSGEAHWSWTVEMGGEEFTGQLASATKTTRGEAERLKRNPAALASPSRQYAAVEARMDEQRSRLHTVFSDGLRQSNPFQTVQSWCMGGAVQAHQWIRRVMLGEKF
jgi:Tfp pilus assembly PilM family ATPase